MSKAQESKTLTILGAILIIITPLWLYIAPSVITPMFCDTNERIFNPEVFGGYELYPCADEATTLAIWSVLGSLCLGALFIYLAGNAARDKNKKK